MKRPCQPQLGYRVLGFIYLLCLPLAQIQPAAAQADTYTTFLPIVTNAAATENPDFGADEIEAELLAEAAQTLPDPPPLTQDQPDPATLDLDGDRVPNDQDNCPTFPNPPDNGEQPLICGEVLTSLIDQRVFLKARTFAPTSGLDPGLQRTQRREHIHALLHVRKNDTGIVLRPEQRQQLEAAGVQLLGYVPHYSYYVSLPRDHSRLEAIAALEMVQGISALRPPDKVAPQVRLRGAYNGRNADNTFTVEVDFFTDVPASGIEQFLAAHAQSFVHQYDSTYWVTLASWHELRRLAIQDTVYWIDEVPDEDEDRTENARLITGAQAVTTSLGYDGAGLTLSMTEGGLAVPITHTAMAGRLFAGNVPLFEPRFGNRNHALMVASIMIANDPILPQIDGLLPAAMLVSYSHIGHTVKHNNYEIPKEARELYGALLNNNSWGPANCAKIGDYSKRGKFYDKAVSEVGISIIYAAGNTRGPKGLFAEKKNCEVELFSLPHPVAKNDISVGNWCIVANDDDCPSAGMLSETSSVGPAADGRLKPDIVAPGDGVQFVNINLTTTQTFEGAASGTSAAAPVVSGITGMVAQAFMEQGVVVESIPPARFKAILLHTAKDVGPPGPDFLHGYGLLQAPPAVRIAQEWSDWGREDVLHNSGIITEVVFPFDITSMMVQFKATLAWDDEEGDYVSTMALKNDLDLTLVSPSGVEFHPFDLRFPFGTEAFPAVPCTNVVVCRDDRNNVEQVLAHSAIGAPLEQGTWEARVAINRLVSDEQPFSLVLTPPCPVVIDQDVTLTDSIRCGAHPLQPEAVVIETANAELNCDGHAIIGDENVANSLAEEYIGVLVTGNNATVRNCTVRHFDVGIALGDGVTVPVSAQILDNTLRLLEDSAVRVRGGLHLIRGNSIREMTSRAGVGVSVQGNANRVVDNVFTTAYAFGDESDTIAVDVLAGSVLGNVDFNGFSGQWRHGVRLHSEQEEAPVSFFLIAGNEFEGTRQSPVRLAGAVKHSVVSLNRLLAWGETSPGIVLAAAEGLRPSDNTVSFNAIGGAEANGQTGIQLVETLTTTVSNNPLIAGVGVGIAESNARGSLIQGNTITNTQDASPFVTLVGIQSIASSGSTATGALQHIENNTVLSATTGIAISGAGPARAFGNTVDAEGIGVSVSETLTPTTVAGNGINANVAGVSVVSAPGTVVNGNAIEAGGAAGISVSLSDGVQVTGNLVDFADGGINVLSSLSATVAGNQINDPGVTGIFMVEGNGATVESNEIDNGVAGGKVGLHYVSGIDAVLRANEITSVAGNVGLRLGFDTAPPCVVAVDNILLEANVLTGGTPPLEVRCDVGTYTLIP